MAEIKPHSFEPMRDSLGSEEEDVHENRNEHRKRKYIVACMRVLCNLGSATRGGMFMLQGDRGSHK